MKRIYKVGFIGKAGSGKTTAAEMLLEEIGKHEDEMKAYILKFADPIYNTLELLGQTGVKPRRFMQEFGDLARREFGDSIFCNIFERDYKRIINNDLDSNDVAYIACDDVRFVEESEMLKDNGFVLVKLICPEEDAKQRLGGKWIGKTHRSETESDKINPDFIIFNNSSLEDLRDQLMEMFI